MYSKTNCRFQLKKISQLKWLNVNLKSNIPKTNDLLDCKWLVKITYFQNALFDTIILSEKPMKIWFFRALAAQIHQTHIHDLVLEAAVFLKKKNNETSTLSFMLKKGQTHLKNLAVFALLHHKVFKVYLAIFQKIKSLIPIRPAYWKHFWAECWQLGFRSTFSIEICLEKNRWDLAFCVNDK